MLAPNPVEVEPEPGHLVPRQGPGLFSSWKMATISLINLVLRYVPHLFRHDALAIPGVAPLCEVVDGGELDEGGEHKGVADGNEPVHSSGVGHFGQRVSSADAQSGHGQDSGHSCKRKGKKNHYVS